MQSIIFPMKYLNITQVWGSGTHRYGYPIDNAGKDSGIDNVFAPFDGVIKKKWANGNTVWLESSQMVLFADGTQDYAVLMVTHDNNISDLAVGQKIKQGQAFYQEGTAGIASGNHIHLEIGKGKFTGSGWHQASNNQWVINNSYRPDRAFVLKDATIVSSAGLSFKKYVPPVVRPSGAVDRIYRGKTLKKGDVLWSSNGVYRAVFQSDGNFVVYKHGVALWSSKTKGSRLVFQGDGNVVIYSLLGRALWNTKTRGKGGYQLVMQSDGNLVLYTKTKKAIWATYTNGR